MPITLLDIIFLVVMLLSAFLGAGRGLLGARISRNILGDRILGFLFGLLRGLVLAFVSYVLLVPHMQPEWIRSAKSHVVLEKMGDWLISFLPHNENLIILSILILFVIAMLSVGIDFFAIETRWMGRKYREGMTRLTTEQLAVVEQRIANQNKSTALAYVLWFFVGLLGIHNFYIGRRILGLVEMILGIGGIAVFIGGDLTIGIYVLATFTILVLLDLFTIPRGLRHYRERLRAKYIAEFQSART